MLCSSSLWIFAISLGHSMWNDVHPTFQSNILAKVPPSSFCCLKQGHPICVKHEMHHSQNRKKQKMSKLICWLRGWTPRLEYLLISLGLPRWERLWKACSVRGAISHLVVWEASLQYYGLSEPLKALVGQIITIIIKSHIWYNVGLESVV